MQVCAIASHAAMQADRMSAEALPHTKSVAANRVMMDFTGSCEAQLKVGWPDT